MTIPVKYTALDLGDLDFIACSESGSHHLIG